MNLQAFQPGELRNGMDEIIRPGAYGKKTAFATADNNGILDYIMNNFEVLKDALSGAYIYAANLSKFPLTGSSDKLYVAEDTGQTYKWNGSAYVLLTSPINGKSAYEIACDNGFMGTAKEWLASIGAETFDSVSVDESGYLTFYLHSGGTLTAPMKPVIEAAASASQAKSWAESESSPDGGTDSDSSTGKTQSAKSWALYSKDRATAAAAASSASASSASAAKASQSDAASSASAAKTSETNAKSSQTAAASSASASASSASAAKSSQTAAANSETNAKSSEDAAVVSAKAAAASQIAAKTSEANAQDYMERSEAILATLITKDGQLVVGSATQPTNGSHWIEPISDRSWTLAASKIVASKDRPDDAYAVWNEMLE